ncbi:MAG: AAA family ATPase [Lawsonella clevelandensis]
MLSELRITNLGVIAETDVELHNGLTVITGETGAGKTMLLSSLQLLTGQRADSSKVRHTAPEETSEARVEGRFETAALPEGVADRTRSVLTECGAQADDDGSVIALRTVRSDGRSRAHLGGRSVPAGTLASFAQPLLAIHGQHDQLRLLNSSQQREALDRFGGDEVRDLLSAYRSVMHQWRERSRELHERQTQGQQRAREFAQLTEAVDEIEKAALCAGEDYHLQEDIRRLMDADELRETASGGELSPQRRCSISGGG